MLQWSSSASTLCPNAILFQVLCPLKSAKSSLFQFSMKRCSFLDACCSLKLCKNHIFKNVNPPNSCVLLLTGEVMRIKTVPTSRLSWDSFHLMYDAYGCSLVAKSCLTLCDPMDCSPPGSSVCGILQARILEWVAIPSSRGSSWPRDQTQVSCFGRQILYHWATKEVHGAY